jgi:hypothetical protein
LLNLAKAEHDPVDREAAYIFQKWSYLGLDKEKLKKTLNEFAKRRVKDNPQRIADVIRLFENKRYSPDMLDKDVISYISERAVEGLTEGKHLREFLKVRDFLGEEHLEIDKNTQERLLEGAKVWSREDGSYWSPQVALGIYELLEKRGYEPDRKTRDLIGKLNQYNSERAKSERLKRKIQRLTRKLK